MTETASVKVYAERLNTLNDQLSKVMSDADERMDWWRKRRLAWSAQSALDLIDQVGDEGTLTVTAAIALLTAHLPQGPGVETVEHDPIWAHIASHKEMIGGSP